jgi:hypothetical protein
LTQTLLDHDTRKIMRATIIIYVISALIWVAAWFPFSFGYYDLPWQNKTFATTITGLAWAHLVLGLVLAGFNLSAKKNLIWLLIATALSGLALACMYNWLGRYLR